MAIFHMHAQVIGRTKGRSCVAAAAYRSGQRLTIDKEAAIHYAGNRRVFDYSRRHAVMLSEIIPPEHSPEWARNRESLWNQAELAEKRVNSQTAREIEVSLPRELSLESQNEIVREFVRDNFTSKGMVADYSIHWDGALDDGSPNNPHAHIMLSLREIQEDGFGKKRREWNDKSNLYAWRKAWSHGVNRALEKEGFSQRVSHRSHADRGVQLEPTIKLWASPSNEHGRGEISQNQVDRLREVLNSNAQKIRNDPSIVLDELTRNKAVFSKEDIVKFLDGHVSVEFRKELLEVCLSQGSVRSMGDSKTGKERFTTESVLQKEASLDSSAGLLSKRRGHRVSRKNVDAVAKTYGLGFEQEQAFRYVCSGSSDIAVIQGFAGAGKSYLLGAANQAWEKAGYNVRGLALSGKAADGLQAEAGIKSRTIQSLEELWRHGQGELSKNDVIVVDEAGMVGVDQMRRLAEKVKEAGAKLVLTGDTEQLQAIDFGAAMRMVGLKYGQFVVSEIRRQKEDKTLGEENSSWMREATRDFGLTKTGKAVEAYIERGHVQGYDKKAEALDSLVAGWAAYREDFSERSQLILAYRRDDVRYLNQSVREILKREGKLTGGISVNTGNGLREFAAGDRMCFLRNQSSLGVKNGSLGEVISVSGDTLTVRLDGDKPRDVSFSTKSYRDIDHGYATTVHKSQGATIDWVHVFADKLFDSYATYVAMSRHRYGVTMSYSREDFAGDKDLLAGISRRVLRENAQDMLKMYQLQQDLNPSEKPSGRPAYELSTAAERIEVRKEILQENIQSKSTEELQARADALESTASRPIAGLQESIDCRPEVAALMEKAAEANKRFQAIHSKLEDFKDRVKSPATHRFARFGIGEGAVHYKEHRAACKENGQLSDKLLKLRTSPRLRRAVEMEITERNIQTLSALGEQEAIKGLLHQRRTQELQASLPALEIHHAETFAKWNEFARNNPDAVDHARRGFGGDANAETGAKLWREARQAGTRLSATTWQLAKQNEGGDFSRARAASTTPLVSRQSLAGIELELGTISQKWSKLVVSDPAEAARARTGKGNNVELYQAYLGVRSAHKATNNAIVRDDAKKTRDQIDRSMPALEHSYTKHLSDWLRLKGSPGYNKDATFKDKESPEAKAFTRMRKAETDFTRAAHRLAKSHAFIEGREYKRPEPKITDAAKKISRAEKDVLELANWTNRAEDLTKAQQSEARAGLGDHAESYRNFRDAAFKLVDSRRVAAIEFTQERREKIKLAEHDLAAKELSHADALDRHMTAEAAGEPFKSLRVTNQAERDAAKARLGAEAKLASLYKKDGRQVPRLVPSEPDISDTMGAFRDASTRLKKAANRWLAFQRGADPGDVSLARAGQGVAAPVAQEYREAHEHRHAVIKSIVEQREKQRSEREAEERQRPKRKSPSKGYDFER